ncbi:DUF4982 domain-containing protein [Sphingobacterium sp. N143]|uniref:glycoside hydrolase family 2 TIM barrel-domain containing protein n=1 Tax=Sphingobacterium sp. N143 TaxID=2746727 RepID=UPI0025778CCF|nr:glycoside hydrolase family 2 TIM barrel-domain containing protein [Sphingobacterium sp. N143]MDM1294775.1 DUF4982 domain-containing protein [Sphingobacterium sp. N143]
MQDHFIKTVLVYWNRIPHRGVKIIALLSWMTVTLLHAQSRQELNFNADWCFKLDSVQQYIEGEPEKDWRTLDLPHDWSIEMPFRKESLAGSGAAYLDGGVGWYKKSFVLPASKKRQRIFIAFEGVYENSEVWINGKFLGKRPNGYIGFEYELSKYLYWDGKKNILTVKVDNSKQPNSRFYSGSGIYRDVKLLIRNPVSLTSYGTFVKPIEVNVRKSTVAIKMELENTQKNVKHLTVLTQIISPVGKVVSEKREAIDSLKTDLHVINQTCIIEKPELWDIASPKQYQVKIQVLSNSKLLDEQITRFGLRSFSFDAAKGFFLNGKHLKIRGVCLHSDLGSLGMAFNRSAALRVLRIMKEMGVNAVRTSHNPVAPAFLDLCDSLGFIVMSETFDVWKGHKNPYDYHLYWDQWYEKDFSDHVKRDRNHPSLFIWCLGNEAQEQWHSKSDGTNIPISLAGIVDSLDGTRPTTIANNEISMDNPVLMSNVTDLIGYNYNHKKWASFPKDYPGKKFIVTESTSALESRGQYDLVPSDSVRIWPERWDIPFAGGNQNKSISAYDNVYTPWGSNHQTSLKLMETFDHISGMYVWTGFDYLGEPTPYTWPARSSYFGIVDLAGFPKDIYYLYQSVWTDKPVLHVLPHWNWKEGDQVDVVVYFNKADRVELFLNGKKIGVQQQSAERYDLVFKGVEFEPGTLEAVSYFQNKEVLRKKVNTAGAAQQIKLVAENPVINMQHNELAFVQVHIIDADGNIVPDAANEIKFSVEEGDATIVATDNGNTTDLTSFQSLCRKAYNGKALAIIASKRSGKIIVKATSKGLVAGQVEIVVN